jgi:hypothetical protein
MFVKKSLSRGKSWPVGDTNLPPCDKDSEVLDGAHGKG